MSVLVHGGAAVPRITKRVFLHTGTVTRGEAVCYNYDATDVSAENEAVLSASAAMWCDARRLMVERPSTTNHMHFAGVMLDDTATGPQWIPIAAPGSVCRVYTKSTVSVDMAATVGTGNIVTFGIGVNSVGVENTTYNGKFIQGGFPGEGSARMLAEGAASVPNDTYLKMAELMVGPSSGGVQVCSYISTAFSAATCIMYGVIDLSLSLTTTQETAGTISVAIGKFIGQRLIVKGPISESSAMVSVAILAPYGMTAHISAAAQTEKSLLSINAATLTGVADYVDIEWNGLKWLVRGNCIIS